MISLRPLIAATSVSRRSFCSEILWAIRQGIRKVACSGFGLHHSNVSDCRCTIPRRFKLDPNFCQLFNTSDGTWNRIWRWSVHPLIICHMSQAHQRDVKVYSFKSSPTVVSSAVLFKVFITLASAGYCKIVARPSGIG